MPSELHNELAKMSLRWLRGKVTGRGIRGGFEVPLMSDYIADAAALCCFQHRFAKQFIGEENFEQIDRYVTIVPEILCVFEAKATRSDFLKTFGDINGNRHTPVGNLHWCVTSRDKKVADPSDLSFPSFWGLLSVQGRGLRQLRKPTFQNQPAATIDRAAHQILWYAKNNQNQYTELTYRNLEY